MLNYQEEQELKQPKEQAPFRMAVVISFTATKAVVRFDGEETNSGKEYKRIYGNTITAGDRVLCAKLNGTYVVVGAIRN